MVNWTQNLAGDKKHVPEWCKRRVGGGIPVPGCERSHWALDQSHSWSQTARKWRKRGSDVILVGVDVENLMIRCVFLPLTCPSTPLAPTARIIFRTLHIGPVINDVPVSTIAWQPPMQPTALPLMVILQAQSNTAQKYYVCLIWMHIAGGPELTCPWGSASTAGWREGSRQWARGSAQDQCHRRLSHCLQGFCARKSELIHWPQKCVLIIYSI